MKSTKTAILLFLIFCILSFGGCRDKNNPKVNQNQTSKEMELVIKYGSKGDQAGNPVNRKFTLDKNKIKQICISSSLPIFQAFDIEDKVQISSIADYLTGLNPFETKLNPKEYCGMAYTIKIRFENKADKIFILSGNKFFMEKGGFTYEIPYKEAIQFDTIVANILESNQTKSGESAIMGEVISIESMKSGRSISCIIKDNTGIEYAVDLKKANIIDSTGNGSMILHDKDVITVFYDKNEYMNDRYIFAATVYIKESVKRLNN